MLIQRKLHNATISMWRMLDFIRGLNFVGEQFITMTRLGNYKIVLKKNNREAIIVFDKDLLVNFESYSLDEPGFFGRATEGKTLDLLKRHGWLNEDLEAEY